MPPPRKCFATFCVQVRWIGDSLSKRPLACAPRSGWNIYHMWYRFCAKYCSIKGVCEWVMVTTSDGLSASIPSLWKAQTSSLPRCPNSWICCSYTH